MSIRRRRDKGFKSQPHIEMEKGNGSGKVIQEDMDQTNSVANNINKILRGIESMSNAVQGLSTRVQRMEAEWQKVQQHEVAELLKAQQDEKAEWLRILKNKCSYTPVVFPFYPNKLPPFPENNIQELEVFRKWVKKIDSSFENCQLPYEEEARHVVATFPENFSWWEQIQKLSMQIDKNNLITWNEIKLMFMVQLFSPPADSLLGDKDQLLPPLPKNID